MTALGWLVAYLVFWILADIVVPGDTTLKTYIGIFFLGGAFRGIINTLWRKQDD